MDSAASLSEAVSVAAKKLGPEAIQETATSVFKGQGVFSLQVAAGYVIAGVELVLSMYIGKETEDFLGRNLYAEELPLVIAKSSFKYRLGDPRLFRWKISVADVANLALTRGRSTLTTWLKRLVILEANEGAARLIDGALAPEYSQKVDELIIPGFNDDRRWFWDHGWAPFFLSKRKLEGRGYFEDARFPGIFIHESFPQWLEENRQVFLKFNLGTILSMDGSLTIRSLIEKCQPIFGDITTFVVAQWMFESKALLNSELAQKYNNLGGVKWYKGCPYNPTPPMATFEGWGAARRRVMAQFIHFPSIDAYIAFKADLLRRRYPQVFSAKTTREYAYALVSGKYKYYTDHPEVYASGLAAAARRLNAEA